MASVQGLALRREREEYRSPYFKYYFKILIVKEHCLTCDAQMQRCFRINYALEVLIAYILTLIYDQN